MSEPDINVSCELIATAVAFIILQTMCIVLRFCARYVNGTRLGADDHLMSLALVCNLCLCGLGLGKLSLSRKS